MKHKVITMKIQPPIVTIEGIQVKMKLPEGCLGICFVFESKKTARAYMGKDVPLLRIEYDEES